MTLVKASIRSDDGTQLQCAFNPTEYSISTGAQWRTHPQRSAESAPEPEFVGTSARTLSMKLLFDAWASGESSVAPAVDTLVGWTIPTQDSISQGAPNPPTLTFAWGLNQYFDAYLKSVSASYNLFKSDGTPIRATVQVTLVEIPDEPAGQNPTSGSLLGHRTTVLGDGDTLQSVAWREYGSAGCWRGLAAANGIDDPLRVGPGTRILVPPRELAEALS